MEKEQIEQILNSVADAIWLEESIEVDDSQAPLDVFIRHAAAAIAAKMEQEREWIPLSERLPKEYDNVLAYSPEYDWPVSGYYVGKSFMHNTGETEGVTHWQPLPNPPQR